MRVTPRARAWSGREGGVSDRGTLNAECERPAPSCASSAFRVHRSRFPASPRQQRRPLLGCRPSIRRLTGTSPPAAAPGRCNAQVGFAQLAGGGAAALASLGVHFGGPAGVGRPQSAGPRHLYPALFAAALASFRRGENVSCAPSPASAGREEISDFGRARAIHFPKNKPAALGRTCGGALPPATHHYTDHLFHHTKLEMVAPSTRPCKHRDVRSHGVTPQPLSPSPTSSRPWLRASAARGGVAFRPRNPGNGTDCESPLRFHDGRAHREQ